MNIYCDFKPGKDSCVDTVLLELRLSNVCRNTLLTYYAEIKKIRFGDYLNFINGTFKRENILRVTVIIKVGLESIIFFCSRSQLFSMDFEHQGRRENIRLPK